MTIFKAILFVIACFVFIMANCHMLYGGVKVIVSAINKTKKPNEFPYTPAIAAVSFTYIMTYLFIW